MPMLALKPRWLSKTSLLAMVGASLLSKTLPCEYIVINGTLDDSLAVGAVRLFTPVLVQAYDNGISKILSQLALLPEDSKA